MAGDGLTNAASGVAAGKSRRRIPNATYRVQFHARFTFRDAREMVPYLYDLGVSDLYASPIFQARNESTHGYDITDYGRLNPALGTETEFRELVEALHERGMGLLLDVVPNHMGIGEPANRWWWDVLEHGQDSLYAAYFDIDWQPPEQALTGRVLLPILGDSFERVLADGELTIEFSEGAFLLRYFNAFLPLAPASLATTVDMVVARAVGADNASSVTRAIALPQPGSDEIAALQALATRAATVGVDPGSASEGAADVCTLAMSPEVEVQRAHSPESQKGRAGVHAPSGSGAGIAASRFAAGRNAEDGQGSPSTADVNGDQTVADASHAESEHNPALLEQSAGSTAPNRTPELRQAEHAAAMLREFAALRTQSPALRLALEQELAWLNGPAGAGTLAAILEAQHYRLACWRDAATRINYRRFFEISDLAGLRVEEPAVFEASHALLLRLIDDGSVTGLRIDHPDGLRDPLAYLRRLQSRISRLGSATMTQEDDTPRSGDGAAVLVAGADASAGDEPRTDTVPVSESGSAPLLTAVRTSAPVEAPRSLEPTQTADIALRIGDCARNPPFFVVVEKILSGRERLREAWPVDGTTGYDFLNDLNALFVQRTNEPDFDALYETLTGERVGFEELVYRQKRRILVTSFASELRSLARVLERAVALTRSQGFFHPDALAIALTELIACFPVYRTYLDGRELPRRDTGTASTEARPAWTHPISSTASAPPLVADGPSESGRVSHDRDMRARSKSDPDRLVVERAVALAGARVSPDAAPALAFLADLLVGRLDVANADPRAREARITFVMKFQQVTGPVMAKGLEDTALYQYNRFVSLNEVGGAPDQFGIGIDEFHRRVLARASRWPNSLLATATHDTKRGEDTRARLNALSQLPAECAETLARWRSFAAPFRTVVEGSPAPTPGEEYLLFQTLLGAWPVNLPDADTGAAFRDRVAAYMLKALREAKVSTSWTAPNAAHEAAVTAFVDAVLRETTGREAVAALAPLQERLARLGVWNALSQTLLKLTAPGVPDIYQGTELWDLSLVDPDNRRPVDFTHRAALLRDLRQLIEAGADLAPLCRALLSRWQDGRVKLFLIAQTLRFRRERPALFRDGAYQPLAVSGAHGERIVAFQRVQAEQRAVVVAPRLLAGLGGIGAPLGAVWGDYLLLIPDVHAGDRFRHRLSGATIEARPYHAGAALRLADLFRDLPVALVERLPRE